VQALRVFKNTVVRTKSGPKRKELKYFGGKKKSRIGWAGHIASIGKMKILCNFLV
jgi:hypothetical protein